MKRALAVDLRGTIETEWRTARLHKPFQTDLHSVASHSHRFINILVKNSLCLVLMKLKPLDLSERYAGCAVDCFLQSLMDASFIAP